MKEKFIKVMANMSDLKASIIAGLIFLPLAVLADNILGT